MRWLTRFRVRIRYRHFAPWLQGLGQDLRYALRGFRREPVFTVSAVLILGLGVGLVTALFTFVNAAFLRGWQVPAGDRMVLLQPEWPEAAPQTALEFHAFSIAEFRYLRDRATTVEPVIEIGRAPFRLAIEGQELERVSLKHVSGNYFAALQVEMLAGRGFLAEEDDYRAPVPVAVISERLWTNRFGADLAVIGRPIQVSDQTYTVVGVARDFLAESPLGAGRRYDVWLPLTARAIGRPPEALARFDDPEYRNPTMEVAGRLGPEVTREEAAAELSALSRQFRDSVGLSPRGVVVNSTRRIATRGMPDAFALGFAALVLVLMLAAANVGNLLLARGLARRRELAIRLSLGASRLRVVRQLLTEVSLLSVMAGALAATMAFGVPAVVGRFLTSLTAYPDAFRPNLTVGAFALGVCALAAALAGLAPALRSTQLDVAAVANARHGHSTGGARLRRLLLVGQIALATVLLAGAGLLSRGIDHATTLDPGFVAAELQQISVVPRGLSLDESPPFFRDLREALERSEGTRVTFADVELLSNFPMVAMLRPPQAADGSVTAIRHQRISANYFDVLDIRVVSGRSIADHAEGELVVSESAARMFWPGENPIGKILLEGFEADDLEPLTVVGVVEDVALLSVSEVEPVVYKSSGYRRPRLLIRDLSPAAVERVRGLAAALHPDVVVTSRPVTDNIRGTLTAAIVGSWIAWGIGAVGLTLASVGAFGVCAYSVEERRREIGIRMALGARASRIVGFVVASSQRSVTFGLIAGLLLALGAAPLLGSYLYGLSPFDPLAYAQVAVILLVAAGLATWVPARRATRVDPAVTLRSE